MFAIQNIVKIFSHFMKKYFDNMKKFNFKAGKSLDYLFETDEKGE